MLTLRRDKGSDLTPNEVDDNFEHVDAKATPGGSDTQIQFNDGGAFGGDAKFAWDKTNSLLTIGTNDWAPYKPGLLTIFDSSFDAYHSGNGIESGLYIYVVGAPNVAGQQVIGATVWARGAATNTVEQYSILGLSAYVSMNASGQNCGALTAFEAEPFISAGTTVTDGVGVLSAVWFDAGSTITNYSYFHAQNNRRRTGSITNAHGLKIDPLDATSGGVVTNAYGVKVENQTGATNNWAIKTGLGKVEFGDTVATIGSANTLTLAGSATTNPVTVTATGSDANIAIKLAPKGTSGFVQMGPDTYGAAGWAGYDINLEIYDLAASTALSTGAIYVEKYAADLPSATLFACYFSAGTQAGGAVNDVNNIFGIYGLAISSLPIGRTASHVVANVAGAFNAGAGTVTEVIAYEATFGQTTAAGTIGSATGFKVDSAVNSGGGTITNNYGVKVEDQTVGATNWAIKTGLGLVDLGDNLKIGKYLEGAEMTAPAAPAANGFRLFAEDDGAGKTRLMCIFATGAAQQLAIQP